MTGNRRGRKPNPEEGSWAFVPNRVGSKLIEVGKTQEIIAEEMNANPTILRHLGKDKITRGMLSAIAAGRVIPGLKMLTVLMIYLNCEAEDLYEPYILTIMDKTGHPKDKHIMDGSYWHEQP